MLKELAAMQLRIDELTSGLEEKRASRAEKRRIADEEIAIIENRYIGEMGENDDCIELMETELTNLCYTKSIVDAVTVHYESKAEEKLARDSEATAELKEADDTGGIKPEDWATFCAKTCVSAPEGVELPEDEPEADQESAEDADRDTIEAA